MTMNNKVLFVDDEVNVLDALKRQHRKKFKITTALSGAEALRIVREKGPFAVLVSDMRMPEMNGVQLLAKVKEIAPDTVRMMLTGNADQETAIQAVNEGSIFRFFTKPCPPELLENGIKGALEQYRLITAEKELLNKTLSGSIKVLTDILSMVNPAAFSRANRIKSYVREMAIMLKLPGLWQFQIAALLSQIGCVTLPSETLEKMYKGIKIDDDERLMFQSHPAAGARLLANISRFELISRMIGLQLKNYKDFDPPANSQEKLVQAGAQILRIVLDYDELSFQGCEHEYACELLARREGEYNPRLLEVLKKLEEENIEKIHKRLDVIDLKPGMIVDQDIISTNGLLLAVKGQEVSFPVIERLRNFSATVGVQEPFQVTIVNKQRKLHQALKTIV